MNNSFRFGSVLFARDSTASPSAYNKSNHQLPELEIKIRNNAQKLRIVKSLNGRADLLFPTSTGTTLAVRYFDVQKIAKLEADPLTLESKKSFKKLLFPNENVPNEASLLSTSTAWKYDFDGVRSFRDVFKHTAVFFILPPDKMMYQLGRMDSVVKLLQSSLAHFPPRDYANETESKKIRGCARSFIVPDHASVLQAIGTIQESLSPAKSQLKEKFFQKECERLLHVPRHSKSNDNRNQMQTQKISSRAAAEHSAAAFRSWADQSGISLADANVVMSVMGSLNKIIESAMDGGGGLEDIPVEDHVKRTILDFFGSGSRNNGGSGGLLSHGRHGAGDVDVNAVDLDVSQEWMQNNHAGGNFRGNVCTDEIVEDDYHYLQDRNHMVESTNVMNRVPGGVLRFDGHSENYYSQGPASNYFGESDVEPSWNHHHPNSSMGAFANANRNARMHQSAPVFTPRQRQYPNPLHVHASMHQDRNPSLSQHPTMHNPQMMQNENYEYGHSRTMNTSMLQTPRQPPFSQQPARSVRQRTSRRYFGDSHQNQTQNQNPNSGYDYNNGGY